ncbi:MAG: CapA family protein [Ignavibacteriae bacterium]|nr:CapA family protein [Ignavibacteriota bacterium]
MPRCILSCIIVLLSAAEANAQTSDSTNVVRLIAVGDVNLGRFVGQQILKGDTTYPFVFVADTFKQYDIVFANLESTLSDQKGETQHPRNNLIFTGPPTGARSLAHGGVTVVSTANNHAIDYGVKSQRETIRYLSESGIAFAGTALNPDDLAKPVIISRNGIDIAFFACTAIMNRTGNEWKQYVCFADTALLLPKIRVYRDSVDFIVVSYHGGDEYSERQNARTEAFAHAIVNGGADLFLGHHPHVPHGIESINGKYIVYSLGNFVFRQPQHYWTQRSFAFVAEIRKQRGATRLDSFRCLPVMTGFQPAFATDSLEAKGILEHVAQLSDPSVALDILR